MDERGLSPVIGFLILVGITAIAAVSIFVAGATLTDSVQSTAEEEQVQRSMSAFAATADEIAIGESEMGRYAIEGVSEGDQVIDPDAGHIRLWIENGTDTDVLLDESLGEMRYETSSGTIFAYQGGGVWRADGEGNSRMIHGPSFHYRSDNDPTVTFRHVTLDASPDSTNRGTIRASQQVDRYPTGDDDNPVDQGTVYAEIDSEYCTGWEQFFRQQTDSAIDESCSVSGDTDVGELRVEFSVPFVVEPLEEPGLFNDISAGESNLPAGSYDDSGHDRPSASLLVERKIDEAQEAGTQLPNPDSTTHTTVGPGLYYVDDMEGGYTFDTSGGDVEVAVDGTLYDDMNNQHFIDITGNGNVSLFVRGDAFQDNGVGGTEFGESTSPEQLRIFMHSDADVGLSNMNAGLFAFLYAPNSLLDFHSSSFEFDGAMVADTLDAGQNPTINLDPDAADIEIEYQLGGEPFYYLHVSETTLDVQND